MASCKLLGLVAETLLCRVWLQVAWVGCRLLGLVATHWMWFLVVLIGRCWKEIIKKD